MPWMSFNVFRRKAVPAQISDYKPVWGETLSQQQSGNLNMRQA